jgi:hypothetical protein
MDVPSLPPARAPEGAALAEAPAPGPRVDEAHPLAAADASRPAQADDETGRFIFGSYGRVYGASDLRGGTGRGTNLVSFGPRLVDEGSYAELELRREDTFKGGVNTRIVATLALFPPFFHFTGKAMQNIGLRNLYAQGTYEGWTLWAGSRMYRGDDIYLLNWWPLDNQNTIGGGVGKQIYKSSSPGGPSYETFLALHAGQQRLDQPWQYQEVPALAPFGTGAVNVVKLDRPRFIETLKLTQFVKNRDGKSGFKAIAYGEAHQISSGVYRDALLPEDRALPSDTGWMAGSQLTYWTGVRDTFASLVLRHARGLAAYDPLSVPSTFALDRSVTGASESRIAVSGNYEREHFGVLAAGYVSFFRDATGPTASTQKYDEGAAVIRPTVFLGDKFGVSAEASYQARRMAVSDPDGDGPLTAGLFRFGLMPYFSPSGRGVFKRPQIRLIYSASMRDRSARRLYSEADMIGQRKVEHFAGLGAEWWFNSSSYP